jgi:hypothetical protein
LVKIVYLANMTTIEKSPQPDSSNPSDTIAATTTGTAAAAVDHARNTKQDEAAMAEVGKVQQFRRNFGFWTILALTASMMCTWEAVFLAVSDFAMAELGSTRAHW